MLKHRYFVSFPYTYRIRRVKKTEFSLVLMHSSYSPDLATYDYFIFCSIQPSLDGKNWLTLHKNLIYDFIELKNCIISNVYWEVKNSIRNILFFMEFSTSQFTLLIRYNNSSTPSCWCIANLSGLADNQTKAFLYCDKKKRLIDINNRK